MKTLYLLLLTLPCWTGIYAQEHEYVPMLREDLIWVGMYKWDNVYYIQIKGDTVVNGITYKKCYRYRKDGEYFQYVIPDGMKYHGWPWYFTDPYIPVSCMREENGKVYRLCDKNVEHVGSFMVADENYTAPRINETDTHYELLVYDFDQPNIYYRGYRYEKEFNPCGEVMIDGRSRRVFTDGNRVMIEGFGMLGGGNLGCDMLEPIYRGGPQPGSFPVDLCIWYIRNISGDVLYRWGDYPGASEDLEEGCARYINDPYDFDDDNNFDIADVNAMINIMMGKRTDFYWDKSADITFDQMVDIEDMNLVINCLLSGVKPVKYSELLAPEPE